MIENKEKYIDITIEYKNIKRAAFSRITDLNYFIDKNINLYIKKGKEVIIKYDDIEENIARWLSIILNTTVYMVPRVNKPENIHTPDYYFKGEYWDLKRVLGTSKRNIDAKIKYLKNQSTNFIIDNSKLLLTNEEVIRQIIKIFKDEKRDWINKIMLIENYKIIVVFKRK